MEGRVDASGVPTIDIEIAGRTWQATIDTGFNGDVELPQVLRSAVNPRYFGRGYSFLAGGKAVEEDQYLVDLPFDGELVEALATFVPGDGILVGTHLLQPYRLTVDFPESAVWLDRE